MSKLNSEWLIGPHGPAEELDDGLLTVAGEIRMPLGNFPRRMTAVRLKSGKVAIWSAMSVSEPVLKRIQEMGEIGFLIVPGIGHRLDIIAWRRRFPNAKVLCSPCAKKMVEEAVKVDATRDVLEDSAVTFRTLAGVGEKESALIVKRKDGTSLVLNDVLANVRHPRGLGAEVMARALGFGVRRPRMPRIGKRMFVTDQKALANDFRELAGLPKLKRIIVSHGDVIADDPEGTLRGVAKDLDS